jgi:hypothetical protein
MVLSVRGSLFVMPLKRQPRTEERERERVKRATSQQVIYKSLSSRQARVKIGMTSCDRDAALALFVSITSLCTKTLPKGTSLKRFVYQRKKTPRRRTFWGNNNILVRLLPGRGFLALYDFK